MFVPVRFVPFLALSMVLTAQTVPPPVTTPVARASTFVLPEQLNMAAILAGPPRDADVDLTAMMKVQARRTPSEIAQAQRDDVEESIFIFADLLGPKFTRENLPVTAKLSDAVRYDAGPVVRAAKAAFHRPRPHHFDAKIQPVCKANPPGASKADFAYPSGHGTTGYLEALVLVQMLPEKRDEILARADAYAHSRVVCGVHYPSDMPASKSVAYAIMGLMMNNPFFQKHLTAAKAEVHAALAN